MAEWVGVSSPVDLGFNWKHKLLLFDRIAIPNLTHKLQRTCKDESDAEVLNDLNWLASRKLAFDPYVPEHVLRFPSQESMDALLSLHERYLTVSQEALGSIVKMPDGTNQLRDPYDFVVAMDNYNFLGPRILAPAVAMSFGVNALPFSRVDRLAIPATLSAGSGEVVQLAISHLPVPGDGHSFDDVLAFRDEVRAQGLLLSLRVWINEAGSGKLTPIELSDKLEDLLSRFERTLALEKMRVQTGVIETVVTTTAEIAEALVKFKWSNIAKKLFEVRHKQVDLMKTEMGAPGREVAYIVKAHDRFGG